MLQVFYLYVSYVYNGLQVFLGVFVCISNACFKCFILGVLCASNLMKTESLFFSNANAQRKYGEHFSSNTEGGGAANSFWFVIQR